MASRYEVQVTISSAKDLKNVNWRHGSLKPYAVVWVDSNYKCSTRVDDEGDTTPFRDQTLAIPLPSGPIEDHILHIDIVHADSKEGTKPLIGSAKLKLIDVLDDVGIGERTTCALQLKRPSGRPQGKLDVKVTIRDPCYRCKNYQNLEKKNNRLMEEMNKFSTCIEFVSPTLLAFLLHKGVIYILYILFC